MIDKIDKIKIKDFQAHKRLDLSLEPITTIAGTTDKGKSSVIRALLWAVTNRPRGESFIRYDADKAAVQVILNNNRITRIKSNSSNIYKLNKQSFKSFGSDVPEPIIKALNLSELNFQQQHDPPFWFSKTGGEVSKQLNKIVNLEVIDKSLSNAASEIRGTHTIIGMIEQRLSDLNRKIEASEFIEELDEDFLAVEELDDRLEEAQQDAFSVVEIIEGIVRYRQNRERALELKRDGLKAISYYNNSSELDEKRDKLNNLIKNIIRQQQILYNQPPDIKPLDSNYNELNETKEKVEDLNHIIQQAEKLSNEIEQTNIQITELNKDIEETIGSRCPLCGTKMK